MYQIKEFCPRFFYVRIVSNTTGQITFFNNQLKFFKP